MTPLIMDTLKLAIKAIGKAMTALTLELWTIIRMAISNFTSISGSNNLCIAGTTW